ncbi:MAG: hypothetical protein MI784_01300 [Cytophagales bacterium]|nr:hypothetical protein [Cytophagales bacterium]
MKQVFSFIGIFLLNATSIAEQSTPESLSWPAASDLPETNLISERPLYPKWEEDAGFRKFSEAVRLRESGDRYGIENKFGFLGAYQFGNHALIDLGLYNQVRTNKMVFLTNPQVQDEAFTRYCMINKYRLRNFISYYQGKTIKDIYITESGILAAAHLLGAEAVKEWFRHSGAIELEDDFGTSLEEYLGNFAGYRFTIEASRKGKLQQTRFKPILQAKI